MRSRLPDRVTDMSRFPSSRLPPIGDEMQSLLPLAMEAAPKRTKRAEDTIAGCEALAASDLARAVKMETRNGQLKLQHSAASWQERAALLRRLETSFNKRKALDKAEWERADAEEQLVESNKDMRDVRI